MPESIGKYSCGKNRVYDEKYHFPNVECVEEVITS